MPDQRAGIERGDELYIRHPQRGPIAVRVLATGRDGLTGECDQGERHGVHYADVLGHKKRMGLAFNVVDHGEDGAILKDERGRRRYLAGGADDSTNADAGGKPPGKNHVKSKTPARAAGSTGGADGGAGRGLDDPLLGRMNRLAKAEETIMEIPENARFVFALPSGDLLKAAQTAGGKDQGDRQWVRRMPDHKRKSGQSQDDKDAPATMKHGDPVRFRHGDVEGSGTIVGSGADGVTVHDGEREHHVRHEHLIGKKKSGSKTEKPSGEHPPEKGKPLRKALFFRKSAPAEPPRPLYARRQVTNAGEIEAWYRGQGCTKLVDPADMHVTQCYSKAPVDWASMGAAPDALHVEPSEARRTEPLGDKGAVVLHFDAPEMQQRHREMMERGASHDFDGYQPHATVSYGGEGFDQAKPWTGPIHLGPEIFEEPKQAWRPMLKALAFFKAVVRGHEQADLFAVPVEVSGYKRSNGKVRSYVAVRHKHAPDGAAAERKEPTFDKPSQIDVKLDRLAARRTGQPEPPLPERTKPKHFYVSAIDGERKHLLAGPYAEHEHALKQVHAVSREAEKGNPRAAFMFWGTAGSDTAHKTPLGENWAPKEEQRPRPVVVRRAAG